MNEWTECIFTEWIYFNLHTNLKQKIFVLYPHIYTRDTRFHIPPHVIVLSAMGNLGVFGFLPTIHTKANAKPMCSRPSCTAQRSTHFCLHSHTAVHAGNTCTYKLQTMIILITGKTRRPPNWAPCRNQDGAGSGIFDVYLCLYHSYINSIT